MSKLKVSAIHDPDNDNEAITVDTSGNVTFSQNATFSGTVTGIESLPDAIDVNASAPADSLAIDSSGKVGIGTTTPSNPLHILATAAGETTVKVESNQAGAMNVALDVDTDRDLVLQFQEAGTTRWDILMNGSGGTNPLKFRDDDGTTRLSLTQDGRATSSFTAQAWATMDGDGTLTILHSHNVSSLQDNGTGDYTANFSNNMSHSDYCAVMESVMWSSGYPNRGIQERNTSNVRVFAQRSTGGSMTDVPYCAVAVFANN